MKYRKLELFFLAITLLAVLSSIIISIGHEAKFSEILGQALFIPVLFIALHYGRQPGFLAATVGALVYLIAKVQELNVLDLGDQDGQLIIVRAALFGLVGIFSSELAARTKYLLVRFSNHDNLNEQTQLYSQNYLRKLISRLFQDYDRHARPFVLLLITATWPDNTDSSARERDISKIATMLRGHVRLIDEVGYFDDNCFCLALPDTNGLAAHLVVQRLQRTHRRLKEEAGVTAELSEQMLSMPENEAEIKAMLPNQSLTKFIA